MKLKVVFIILIVFLPEMLLGQSFYSLRRERNLILVGGIGTTHYKGDLANPHSLDKTRYNLSIGAEYQFFPRISARAEFTYFRLDGDDAVSDDEERRDRNLSFFSNNLELNVVGIVSLLPIGPRYYQRPIFNLYGFGGIGLMYTNPKTERDNGEKVALQPIQTEGVSYSRFQPVILGGMGIKYMVDPFLNIGLEVGYRLSFTDYLDDVSAERYYDHPDAGYTLTDPLAIELNRRNTGPAFVRGNPENNDGYLLMSIKVEYYLPYEVFKGTSQRKLYNRKRKAYYRRR